MKRFHVNVGVADLSRSVSFYTELFGQEPTVIKPDYAKWMLDDPRINFSVNESAHATGVNHVGVQADTVEELEVMRARLDAAGTQTFEQPDAECCYAKSTKTWVRDPDNVAWETFVTHEQISDYGNDRVPGESSLTPAARCCQ